VSEPIILEGWVSIRAALISGSRDLYEILIHKGKLNPNLSSLLKRAQEKNVPVRQVGEAELAELVQGQTHGGVVARVGPRKLIALDELGQGPSAAFIAMLDGVEDPYNFGQAVRALYAAGAHGLVLRERNWTTAAATVARASAGASEFMPMAVVQSDAALIHFAREHRLQLICTGLEQHAISLYDAQLREPLLLLIGGERRGVSKPLLQAADLVLTIPYGRNFKQALDTTSASAAIAFEIMRQRRYS
jgi:23S rRNA (guanosine2251-2'-O)-methyltransferase